MIERNGQTYYKLGLHIHTTLSDGVKTPEEAVQAYQAQGYDAIALTDHWVYGSGGQIGGMHILSGCEYNSKELDSISGVMHLVGIGMNRDPKLPRDAGQQQIVDAINAAGGIAVLAHPAWSVNALEDAKNLNGVVASEIYNAVSEVNQSVRAYSSYFVDVCANAGIYYKLFATDDVHYYDDDLCKGWVMVRAETLTDAALLQALRQGNFYATQGPELYVRREGNALHIECSPCSYIAAVSNLVWCRDRVKRGQGLTCHTYEIKPSEKWIRVEVRDAEGRYAWSNMIEL